MEAKLNYDQELSQEGVEMAEAISEFANRDMLERGFEEFADHLANKTHPTLQQSVMRLMWKVMRAYAKKGYTDARNEATVNLCRKLTKEHEDWPPLPFI